MAKLHSLFRLVKGLTKSEKRYFKISSALSGSADKDYIILFNIIDKAEDENIIKEQFNILNPRADLEVCRKYLYKIILKMLVSLNQENDVDYQLNFKVQQVRILFDRSLADEGKDELTKAKILALKHERHLHYLLLVKMELQYALRNDFLGWTEAELVKQRTKIKEYLSLEIEASDYASLYELLQHRFNQKGVVRSEVEKLKLDDLIFHEIQLISRLPINSFEVKKLHLLFQSAFFMATGSFSQSLDLFRKLENLYSNKNIIKDSPVYYIYLLRGILNNLLFMRQFDELPYFIEKLKRVEVSESNLDMLKAKVIYKFEILHALNSKDINSAFKLSHTYEAYIRQKSISSYASYSNIYLHRAIILFMQKNYSDSLYLINQILNKSKGDITRPLYTLSRIINLILHFELHNYDYLKYEVRSFERTLKSQRRFYEVEKIIFNFIKKYMNTSDTKKMKGLIKETKNALHKLKNNKFENQLLTTFDLEFWMESKLTPYVNQNRLN